MTDVGRVGWMDNAKSDFLKEIIEKEDRIASNFHKAHDHDEEAELAAEQTVALEPVEPPPPPRELTVEERDHKMLDTLSKHMWRTCNPGYVPNTHKILPKSKEDFAYKVDELDPVDKSFFRRRDNFTKYVEASAMYKLLSKKGS